MIVDGVKINDLLRIMNRDIRINETDYRAWREKRVSERRSPRNWIRASDFPRYWQCARMLHFETHNPLPTEPSKHLYYSTVRHSIVEDFLVKHGWECEVRVEKWFNVEGRQIKCVGRIDSLSPSKIVLEIKTGRPRNGHLLQAGCYQLHIPQSPAVILLYGNGTKFHKNLRPLAKKDLPRVTACILSPFKPPLHPSFPDCGRTCIYIKRCRHRRDPSPTDTSK